MLLIAKALPPQKGQGFNSAIFCTPFLAPPSTPKRMVYEVLFLTALVDIDTHT
jgi:hypothetical protein